MTRRRRILATLVRTLAVLVLAPLPARATTYEVGPGKPYASIGAVPWESLLAGDTVLIHWRTTPYKEKWVIGCQGTAAAPITVRGIPGPGGELPVVDGNGATTRLALDFWSETRGIVKIGGSSIPADTMPRHIVIESLDIRSARSSYTFTDDSGATQAYGANASAIYVEKGENITVRNCVMHDAGNGFFVASSDTVPSRNILVESNYIFDNGNPTSAYEHNSYTAAIGITFQFNRYGPLRSGAIGNALKDRSAGLVVRYNWIEGGNRQLDLVNGEDSSAIRSDPGYRTTHAYGNVLIENAGTDNRQIVHYGGDTGASSGWRKGTLHFYGNTVVSKRTDRTTLFRLSTNEERCDARNNLVYVTAAGSTLAILDDTGIADLSHNWFKPGWVPAFFGLTGTVRDDGTSVLASSPGFANEAGQDYHLSASSGAVDAGTALDPAVLPLHALLSQYVKHQSGEVRPAAGVLDVGAFELGGGGSPPDLVVTTTSLPNGTTAVPYGAPLAASGGIPPYEWALVGGTLPPGLTLAPGTGVLSGTPTTAGTWTFTVEVTDSQAIPDAAQATLSIGVSAPPVAPLVVTTTSLPQARRNKTYRQTLQATGGMPPYRWSMAAGSLPPGLSLNTTTGELSGKPTTSGTWGFTVQAADNQSPPAVDQQGLSLRVR